MKATFLKTGSLQEVDIVVQRMSNQSVKDQDTEKPVTKLMLKEIYKWDECCPQNFDMHACMKISEVLASCHTMHVMHIDLCATESDD